MVRVWDIFVRVSHWTVAVGFFIAYFTEDEVLSLHVWAGYAVGVFVVMRILWGFVGPRHARFTDFLYGPHKVFSYLRDLAAFRAERHLGHSPAGGAMAIALWIGLLAIVWSGLELYAVEEGGGPLASKLFKRSSPPTARSTLLKTASSRPSKSNPSLHSLGLAWATPFPPRPKRKLPAVILQPAMLASKSLVRSSRSNNSTNKLSVAIDIFLPLGFRSLVL